MFLYIATRRIAIVPLSLPLPLLALLLPFSLSPNLPLAHARFAVSRGLALTLSLSLFVSLSHCSSPTNPPSVTPTSRYAPPIPSPYPLVPSPPSWSCNVSDKVVSQGVSVTNDVETLQTKSLEHKTVA